MTEHDVTLAELSDTTDKLLHEITTLKSQLEYETRKHKQWKELAMTFHDSLWSLVEEYVLPQHQTQKQHRLFRDNMQSSSISK